MLFTKYEVKHILAGTMDRKYILALPEPDGTGSHDCEDIYYPNGQEAIQRYTVQSGKWRTIWQVGRTYAVQTERGKPALGRIRVTALERVHVALWKVSFELVKEA